MEKRGKALRRDARISDEGGCSAAISRRDFIKGVIGGSAGVAASPLLKIPAAAEEQKKSRVVIVRNPEVIVSRKVNVAVAEEMVNRAVCSLTGKASSGDAWRSLFSPTERVAIKVNALFPPVTSNPEVILAIVKGLKEAGLRENNIIIQDRGDEELVRARFTINQSSKGVRCHGVLAHSDWMQAEPGLFRTRLCKLITDEADAIINVPSLKVHHRSGVTLSLKNLLGCIPNAGETHGGGCPRIADISALDPIKKKTRLIVIDGVRAQYDRGPGYSAPFVWNYGGIVVSRDTVAADIVGANEILKKRHASGVSGPIRPSLIHITKAGELGLGVGDLRQIEVLRHGESKDA